MRRPPAIPISNGPSAMRSARSALRMMRSNLLCPDVGGLDQWPPFLDLGLVVCGERLGGLLLGWRDFLAKTDEALAHSRIGERRHGGGGKFRNDVAWRTLGHPQAIPGRNVHARRAGLID